MSIKSNGNCLCQLRQGFSFGFESQARISNDTVSPSISPGRLRYLLSSPIATHTSCIPLHITCIQQRSCHLRNEGIGASYLTSHRSQSLSRSSYTVHSHHFFSPRLRTTVLRGATIACSPSRLISPCAVLFFSLYHPNLTFYFIPSWTYASQCIHHTLQQCSSIFTLFLSFFFSLFLFLMGFWFF
ncbi:uncharacterized protein EDB93DRAFT_650636 [Suillus bovinus]|uniref:uncharacterized protein n=1 Tax=Suillus bovinus TaxID=48563 RepID=UPI001B88072B|nr:uncharacterized protein EDB93DRAFT_650636 [Suillus bovinus]KAG2140966.1 hypothetical protein EDB93DRAFT_650636 [Suillus bovinus]